MESSAREPFQHSAEQHQTGTEHSPSPGDWFQKPNCVMISPTISSCHRSISPLVQVPSPKKTRTSYSYQPKPLTATQLTLHPNPYGLSCGWWIHKKAGLCHSFRCSLMSVTGAGLQCGASVTDQSKVTCSIDIPSIEVWIALGLARYPGPICLGGHNQEQNIPDNIASWITVFFSCCSHYSRLNLSNTRFLTNTNCFQEM